MDSAGVELVLLWEVEVWGTGMGLVRVWVEMALAMGLEVVATAAWVLGKLMRLHCADQSIATG